MIAGIGVLVLAAALIAFWVWMRHAGQEMLAEMARLAGPKKATDPWEEPRIVATYGGIHDVEEDQWT